MYYISAIFPTPHRKQRSAQHAEGRRRHQLLGLLQHVEHLLHRTLRGGLRSGDRLCEFCVERGGEFGRRERGDADLLHEENGAVLEILLQLRGNEKEEEKRTEAMERLS